MPTAPVLPTCVPPHADRSKSAISTRRSAPARTVSFLSARVAASSGDANRTDTSRSSQTTRLASSTARSISTDTASRARSIVDTSAPM